MVVDGERLRLITYLKTDKIQMYASRLSSVVLPRKCFPREFTLRLKPSPEARARARAEGGRYTRLTGCLYGMS